MTTEAGRLIEATLAGGSQGSFRRTGGSLNEADHLRLRRVVAHRKPLSSVDVHAGAAFHKALRGAGPVPRDGLRWGVLGERSHELHPRRGAVIVDGRPIVETEERAAMRPHPRRSIDEQGVVARFPHAGVAVHLGLHLALDRLDGREIFRDGLGRRQAEPIKDVFPVQQDVNRNVIGNAHDLASVRRDVTDETRQDVVEIITGVGEVLPGKQFLHRHRVVGEASDPRLIQVEDVVRARSSRSVRAHLRQDAVEGQQLPYDVDTGEWHELMLHDLARRQGGRRVLGHDAHGLPGKSSACVPKKFMLIARWLDRGARARRRSDVLDRRWCRCRSSRPREAESRKTDSRARTDPQKGGASNHTAPQLVGCL